MTKNKERALIIVWLVVNLVIGLWIVRDYGLSYDEPDYFRYADYSLAAYPSFFGQLFEPDYGFGNLQYYGPAFILIVNSIVKMLDWLPVDFLDLHVWHYAYFVVFQLTGLCLYGITKRWFSSWAAWAVLVLFITQPILWGHAFINPKDIPFMFFFSFSVWAGYRLVDSFGGEAALVPIQKVLNNFQKKWAPIDPRRKRNFLFGSLLILLGLAFSRSLVNLAIERVITFFYSAAPGSWAESVMMNYAEHVSTIPVEVYVAKAQTLYARYDFLLFILGFMVIGGYLIVLLTDTSLLVHGKCMWHRIIGQIRWQQVINFSRQILKALFSPKVILAGVVLGLTTSVRILGPLAGMIVILYLVVQVRAKSAPIIFGYLFWTGLFTYLSWPFLWSAPFVNFYESLHVMSNFPWQGEVLFNGDFYSASTIPMNYLPVLMNLQFTETFIILGYLGLGFFIWDLFRKDVRVDLLLYIGMGFLLPIIYLIVFRSPLYDNFRQLLFLLPAMFLLSAFVLEFIFEKIRQNWLRLSLIVIIIVPGLISSFQLHPYQYIYYNSFIGGIDGAFRRFELDYWLTSMNELTAWANENAEEGAKIVVKAAPYFMAQQLRPDIRVKKMRISEMEVNDDYDYAILTARWNSDEHYPDAEIDAVVERGGAILGVVKFVKGQRWK